MAREAGLTPQRLGNYLSGRTVPDSPTIDRLAAVLRVDAGDLSGAGPRLDERIVEVLTMVLQLDGQSPERADAVARTTVEALRVLRALPDDGPVRLRARLAAQAAWQTRAG